MATAGSLDYFIRSIWQGGAGIAEAMRGIGGLGQAAKKTDLELSVARRQTQLYQAGMRALAKDVQSGKISMEAAEVKARALREEMGQSEGQTRQSGLRWMEMKAKLDLASQAFQTVRAAAAEVWQTVGEGAQLELAESRFEKLAGSIGASSDSILQKFGAATGGMMSNAEMVASASQIISLNLAGNETDVVRLGNVVGQLGLDMQQVIMTFANDSKMRLDALGLSITDVEARTKAYTDAGMDASKAFDMAVLDALEAKLALIGSAAGTTVGDMQKLDVAWVDLTDTAKQFAATQAAPAISEMASTLDELNQRTEQGHPPMHNLVLLIGRLNDNLGGWGGEAFTAWLDRSTKAADGLSDKMEKVTEEVATGMVFTAESFSGFMSLEQMYARQGQAIAESSRVALLRREQAVAAYGVALAGTSSMESQYAQAAQATAAASQQASLRYQFQAEQAAAAAEATRLINQETANFFNELAGNSELAGQYADILGQVETATVAVGGRTEEQNSELERLQGIYARTQQSISDYSLGIKGAAMTEESRAKKLEELNAVLANTQAAMDPLLAISSEYTTVTSDGATNTELLNQKLFEQIQAHSDNAAATALAGYELGIFSQAEAEAMLKAALLEEAIRKQAGAWDGSAEGLRNIQADLQGYIQTLNNMPSLVETEVRTNYTSQGGPPAGAAGWTAGQGIPEFSRGGVVRGGVPGRDSVPALLMPGERVLSVAQNRALENGQFGGGGRGDTYIINTQDRADLVVAQMARRQRERKLAGL